MAVKRIICRDHGGVFIIQSKRGRQPVRCNMQTPCDRAEGHEGEARRQAERAAMDRKEETSPIGLPRQRHAEASKPANPSLPLAKAAKERLVATGWVVQGKAGVDDTHAWASITASRNHETLNMLWSDGELAGQNYSMEFQRPQENNYPDRDLPFNPDEVTDSQLVRLIKGMKVTWWNTIAGAKETAIIGGNVTVEHIFFADGSEDESKRIVKFIDHGGGGFRAFHVSALLKVG